MTGNLFKLPSFVDVHVHLREPGGTQKEDFETGTQAAVAGGYTQILDMPNNIPPTDSPQRLSEKIKLTNGKIFCDIGFNFAATPKSTRHFSKIYSKVFGLKVYMNQTTGTLLIENAKNRESVFKSWTSKLPIMVHAEGETVGVAIKLAKKYKKSLHVCHVSLDQLKIIRKARNEGCFITCEICPHHLFLTRADEKRLGPLGMMKPPLLSKRDKEKLWDHLDEIDMISTDHAPHTLKEKFDQLSPKFGVPGLETTLPLMLEAVHNKLITMDRLVVMLSDNPRRVFKLPHQPNTYIVIDKSKRYKISDKNLFTKCKWTPFKGLTGRGEVKKVVIRGKTIFKDSKILGKPIGKVIFPNF